MNLFRRKTIDQLTDTSATGLHRTLSAFDLVMLGVGAIIGAGIFVLTGHAAATAAGPAIILSFVLAGFACALAAFCYSELASMIPVAGSAYTYSYAAFGEIIAWMIGWILILEFSVGAATVAIGWSGYVDSFLASLGITIPREIATAFSAGDTGGIVNLPAMLIILAVSALLYTGMKLSTLFNFIIVILKVAVILIFVLAGAGFIQATHYTPFMPFGLPGVITGAALVFFAYIGFDVVATAAQETKNPERAMPIGILGSLAVCTVLYLAVAAVLVGVIPYTELNVSAPIAKALDHIQMGYLSPLIKIGAIAGLTTAILGLLLGQVRVFYAMGRDRLLPDFFARVHPRFASPHIATAIVGGAVALIAGLSPIGTVAELVSMGTLAAFSVVCGGVLVLRYTDPARPRGFKVPFFPALPILGLAINMYLMLGLPLHTWLFFAKWVALGLIVYFLYSYKRSTLNRVP